MDHGHARRSSRRGSTPGASGSKTPPRLARISAASACTSCRRRGPCRGGGSGLVKAFNSAVIERRVHRHQAMACRVRQAPAAVAALGKAQGDRVVRQQAAMTVAAGGTGPADASCIGARCLVRQHRRDAGLDRRPRGGDVDDSRGLRHAVRGDADAAEQNNAANSQIHVRVCPGLTAAYHATLPVASNDNGRRIRGWVSDQCCRSATAYDAAEHQPPAISAGGRVVVAVSDRGGPKHRAAGPAGMPGMGEGGSGPWSGASVAGVS